MQVTTEQGKSKKYPDRACKAHLCGLGALGGSSFWSASPCLALLLRLSRNVLDAGFLLPVLWSVC